MILGDHALGHGGRREGKLVTIDHRPQQRGIPDAHGRRAEHCYRPASGPQDFCRALERRLRGRTDRSASRKARGHGLGGRGQRDVLGKVQVHGPKGLAEGDLQRLGQYRCHPTLAQSQGRLGDGSEERVVVDGHLNTTTDLRRRKIARDGQEWRAIEVGVAHAGREVGGAGTQGRDAQPRCSGEPAHDIGCEGRRAFVRREYVWKLARSHGFEQGQDIAAGDSKAVAHACAPQGRDGELGVVHEPGSVFRVNAWTIGQLTRGRPEGVGGASRCRAGRRRWP